MAAVIVALLILVGYHAVFVGIGYALGKRSARIEAERLSRAVLPASPHATMLREIETSAFGSIVGPEILQQLREHYGGSARPSLDLPAPTQVPLHQAALSLLPGEETMRQFVPPRVTVAATRSLSEPGPSIRVATDAVPPAPPPTHAETPAPPRPILPLPRAHREREPIHLDPALVLLYLGAFLIVAAGLIYASFNWEELQGAQKIGLLSAATVGFIMAGALLLSNTRLRPAAETFIGIGALLIPSNIIAAMTILSDTPLRATLALQIGAALATVLYTIFAFRPGALVYRYAAVISAIVAIGVLPASLGAHRAWALPLIALAPTIVLAVLDRFGRRSRRFLRPAYNLAQLAGIAALVATALTGLPVGDEEIVIAVILASFAINLGTVGVVRKLEYAGYSSLVVALGALALALGWFEQEAARMAVATGLGLLMVGLLVRGPRFYRTTLADGVGAAALIAFAANLMAPEYGSLPLKDELERLDLSWSVAIASWLIPTGWLLVTMVRHWWPTLSAIAIAAFAAWGATLAALDALPYDWTTPLRFAPAMIVLAAIPAWLRVHGTPALRRLQALWLWIGFAALSVPVTGWVLAAVAEHEPQSRLLAIAYLAFLAITAVTAAQQYHFLPAMLVASLGAVAVVVIAVDPIPVGEAYRWPILAGAFTTLVLAMPLLEGMTWWRRPANLRGPMQVLIVVASVTAALMASRIVELLVGEVSLDDAPWWRAYTAVLAVAAVVLGLYARYRFPLVVTSASAVSGMFAIGLALRAGVLRFEPDPLIWPAIGIAIGLAAVITADRLDSMPAPLALLWARWVAGFAGLLLLLPLTWAVAQTAEYIGAAWSSATVAHGDEPIWWVPLLAAYTATAAMAHRLARRRPDPLLTTGIGVSAVATMLAASLVLSAGMERFDPEPIIWTAIGIALAAVVAPAALRISDLRTEVARRWSAWVAAMALLLAAPSLLWALPNTLAYIASGWGEIDVVHGGGIRWWLPMLAAFVATAILGHVAVRGRGDPMLRVGVGIAAVAAMLAASMVISTGMQRLNPEPLIWTAVGIVLAALVAVAASKIAENPTMLAWHWSWWITAMAGMLAAPSLAWALPNTLGYIARGWVEVDAPHDAEVVWWVPLLLAYAAVALTAHWIAQRQMGQMLAIGVGVSALTAALAASMVISTGMQHLDPDPLIWPPIGIGLALLVAEVAIRLYDRPMAGARLWSGWTAAFAMLLLMPAGGAAIARTTAYIASRIVDTTVPHLDEPLWWVPMLLAFVAVDVASHWTGLRRDIAGLSVVTLVGADLSVALVMRMLTTDLFAWTVAGMVFGGTALLAALVLAQASPDRPYLFTLGQIIRVMPLIGIVGLVTNIAGGFEGSIDPARNVVLYAVVAAAIAGLSIRIRWPNLIYASSASLALTILFLLLVPGVDTLDALLVPVVASWVLVLIALAPRLTAAWSRPLERSAWGFGAIPIAFSLAEAGTAWSIDGDAYQRLTLSIMSAALVVGIAALVMRSPLRGTVAVVLATVAALRQVATFEPESWQPYAAVLAIALALAGVVWHRWPSRSDPLYALAGAVLIGIPFFESFTIGGTTDAFVAGGYGILVVILGLIARRQEPVAVGVIGVTLVVLRQMVDTAMAFESWQVLGTAGAILLIGGTVILLIRDSLRRWLNDGQHLWHSLG